MRQKTLQVTITILQICFVAGIAVVAFTHPAKWLAFPVLPWQVQQSFVAQSEVSFYAQLPLSVRALQAAVSLLPASVLVLQFLALFRLFGWFRQGRFFDAANVRLIQRLGALLLVSAPVDIIARLLMDVCLNLARAPGHKVINIGVNTGNFQAATVGLIVLVAAAIMQQGCAIAEENRFTI